MSNKGWECPKCGRCFAPQVRECAGCAKGTVVAPDNTFINYPPITHDPNWHLHPASVPLPNGPNPVWVGIPPITIGSGGQTTKHDPNTTVIG